MTIAPTLTTDKTSYNKGEIITATYGGIPANVPATVVPEPLKGVVTIDSVDYPVSGTVNVTTVPAHTYVVAPKVPTINGVAMTPGAGNPLQFTAVAS